MKSPQFPNTFLRIEGVTGEVNIAPFIVDYLEHGKIDTTSVLTGLAPFAIVLAPWVPKFLQSGPPATVAGPVPVPSGPPEDNHDLEPVAPPAELPKIVKIVAVPQWCFRGAENLSVGFRDKHRIPWGGVFKMDSYGEDAKGNRINRAPASPIVWYWTIDGAPGSFKMVDGKKVQVTSGDQHLIATGDRPYRETNGGCMKFAILTPDKPDAANHAFVVWKEQDGLLSEKVAFTLG